MKKNKVVELDLSELTDAQKLVLEEELELMVEKKTKRNKQLKIAFIGAGVIVGGIVLANAFHVKPQEIVEVVSEELGE